ncbi:MAG: AsmA family protein, partial [Bryobacteraceae bacterium]
MTRKRALRLALIALLLLVLTGIAAPYIRADRYGQQIQNALQQALGRKVEIGQVRFNLFTGPGFTIENVVIYDDPSAGIEPFAHMEELQARIRLSTLFTGKIAFASLRFVDPHVNLVKPDTGSWNIVPLLARTAPAPGAASLPGISVSGGRIYFKFGDVKSSFYLTGTDFSITPERNAYNIRFNGSPARTDRSDQGFGEFVARGRWRTDTGKLDLDVNLEPSSIDELATLIRGQSPGWRGMVISQAKISGPLANLQIKGRLDLQDVYRWNFLPANAAGWGMNYSGSLDMNAQKLELVAGSKENPNIPVSARLLLVDILYNPRWNADLTIDNLPASSLVDVARHLGADVPADVQLAGDVKGLVGYGPEAGLQGELNLSRGAVRLGSGEPLSMTEAQVRIHSGDITLARTTAQYFGHNVEVEGSYQSKLKQVDATSTVLHSRQISSTRYSATSLVAGRHLDRGDSAYSRSVGPGADLRDSTTHIEGLAERLRIETATVALDGDRLVISRMHLRAGEVEIFGSYRYEPEQSRPHQFNLAIPSARSSEIERLLMPTIRRQNRFLARFRRTSLPAWLKDRAAEGELRFGKLLLDETAIRALRSHVIWDGATIQFTGLEARLEDSFVTGTAQIALDRSDPAYRLRGALSNFSWKGGRVDLAGTLLSQGIGSGLLANLRSEGTFQARAIEIIPDHLLRSATGGFEFQITPSGPQIRLNEIRAAVGTERFGGEGVSTDG